jgi:PAS domain S-box
VERTEPDLKPFDFLYSVISEGVAYCKLITDEQGQPVDWVYLYINRAYEQINGVKSADVVGKKATEVLPDLQSDAGDWLHVYGEVALTGKSVVIERYSDTRKRWYHVSAYCPQKGYFVSIFEDVTERKKVENELLRTKADWERTFDAVPDLIAVLDNNNRILHANKAMAQQLGVAAEKAVGLICYQCVHCATKPPKNCPHAQLLKDGKQHTAEVHEPHLGGDFIVTATPLRDAKGDLVGSIHVARNITGRKQAEDALRESEQRWSTMLSSIGDAVIATDTEGRVTFLNPVAEHLTGWTLAEAKRKPIKEVFHIVNEYTRAEVESPVAKVLKSGLIVGLANHTVLIRKDGTEVPIDDSGAPIVAEDGSIRGVVLVFRDITERKKVEDALRRQAALIDLSPDAIIVRKLDGTITFWSRGAEKLYGWSRKEAIGRSTYELFKTKYPEPFEAIVAKLEATKSWSGELIHRTKSGQEVAVQSWWLTEQTEHGQIKSIMESNVDLTERKLAEHEIAQAKQRLDAHMNNAPEAVIEFDPKLRVIRWSEQATKVFGWSKDEILGKSITEMPWVYKDDVAIVQKVSADMLEGRRPSNVNHNRNLRKDGSVIDCDWYNSAIYDSEGHLVSILSQVIDVTEQKKAEKEIARLASYPTLNPNPVLEVDLDGKVTYANPATKKLFPTLETDGLNNIFFGNWASVKKAFNDQDAQTFSREIKVNNHWYQQQLYRMSETQRIRIYTTDIDELKQTEEAREKGQRKLQEYAGMLQEYAGQMEKLAEQRAQQLQAAERLAAIGQTAGMVGHDIRNPLQAITGDMYLIGEEVKEMSDGEGKEAILESIESVNRNLMYINKIVSDLQDYTRPLKPNLQNANLSELVQGTLATLTIPKGIDVAIDIKENAKPLKTDAAFMRRILTNLMTNAVQAMQEEGKLTIKASKPKDTVVLTIVDTGIGIPDEVKAKMFTPLFTTKSKGQGLGLAVVKRLVEALGGSIGFESVAGKGTKFTVELPQKQ